MDKDDFGIVKIIIYIATVVLMVVGLIYTTDQITKDTAQNQINQSRDFANKTITSNNSTADKITISKYACDMYYTYGNKNECYEQVIKEHV